MRPPRSLRLLGSIVCALLVGACGKGSEPAAPTPSEATGTPEAIEGEVAPATTTGPDAPAAPAERGMFVRRKGKERYQFEPWVSVDEANRVLRSLRRSDGGEVHFTPGLYVIDQPLRLSGTPDVVISATASTRFEFAPAPAVTPVTTKEALPGDTTLTVDDASGLHVGWDYQLYAPDWDSSRVLEFTIAGIEGNVVELKQPVAYMPKITQIPEGSRLYEAINFFEVLSCPNLTFEGLSFDGIDRGVVRGHTLYGGIYASGQNTAQERPTINGLTVRNCRFRRLRGRGIAAYGIGDIHIVGSTFRDIYAQAIEIDHFSSGLVQNNLVDGSETGVMLNDAFESVVEGNVLLRCKKGVRILRIFPQDWVNLGNTVRDNHIGYCDLGISFEDNITDGVTGNYVLDNHFMGIEPLNRIIDFRGNTVTGNTHD